MTLLFTDGFDAYTSTPTDLSWQYTNEGNNAYVSTALGRYGGGALTLSGGSNIVYYFDAAQTNVWVGFAINYYGSGSGNVLTFNSGAGTEASVFYDPGTGVWSLFRGVANTNLASATKNLPMGGYHWIDCNYLIDGTTGILELWIDGVLVVTFTGNTTQNAQSSINSVTIGTDQRSPRFYADDFYVLNTAGSVNNTKLGDCRIESVIPSSDTSPNNGTPSTGTSHFACVDALPSAKGATSIDLVNTSGQGEVFGHSALVSTPATIVAVNVKNLVKKTDAGACSGESVVFNTVSAVGPSRPLLTTFSMLSGIFEIDPHTSAAWTYAHVNAADIGFVIP